MKKSEIKLVVSLDEKNVPEKIEWIAEDSLNENLKETKSISLSLWDEEKKKYLKDRSLDKRHDYRQYEKILY